MARPRLSDFLTPSDISALHRPTGEAVGLPGPAYSAGFFALEQQHLFSRTWCAVAIAPQVPNPGDAVPVDLAGWPLLVVRNRQGEIRVFYNVCRHRGMRLCSGPRTGLKNLACPWHSWLYDLDGNLLGTPDFSGERVKTVSLDHSVLGLKPVRSAQWLDFVFVNLDGQAPSLEDHLRPLQNLLKGRDLGSIRYGGVRWGGSYDVNWKLLVEGGIEDYHLPWVHPEIMRGVIARNVQIFTASGVFAATSMNNEYASVDKEEYLLRLQEMPTVKCTEGADPNRTYFMNIFPTGGMGVKSRSVDFLTTLPDGPGRTRLTAFTYFVGEGATDPRFEDGRRYVEKRMEYVFDQDRSIWNDVQANARRPTSAGIRTRFSPVWEGAIHQFQTMVVDAILDGEARTEAVTAGEPEW
jgi:phenylpropionate dioxygenase-like ring-hydroxylating dioxygenase large terminal subunit